MDVADAGSQEINAQGSDAGALLRIGDLAGAHDAVLDAADGTDLSLDGQALVMGVSHQLLGLGNVLVDGVVGTIEHDGGEAGLDAGLGALVGAVVQMQRHRHRDAQALVHGLDHSGDRLETGHVLAGALRDTQDHRALHGLGLQQDGLGPLQVVDVELTDAVMAVACLAQHIGCIYQHR